MCYKVKYALILLCGFFSANIGNAQNADPRKAYEDFKNQAKQKFYDFRKQANEQYAMFLLQAWKQFNVLPANPLPKDDTIPPIIIPEKDKGKPIETKPIPIKDEDIVTSPNPTPQPVPIGPIEEQAHPNEETVEFLYCGTKCHIRMNRKVDFSLTSCDNEELFEAWTSLSQEDLINNTIRDCLALRMSMNLCDWAYFNLVQKMATTIYNSDANKATLLTIYILVQSGYDIKVGRKYNEIYLFFSSVNEIYKRYYFIVDNIKYYPFVDNCNLNGMEICVTPQISNKPIALYIEKEQIFSTDRLQKRSIVLNDWQLYTTVHYPCRITFS